MTRSAAGPTKPRSRSLPSTPWSRCRSARAPHECYGLYEPLFSHLDGYAAQLKQDPEQGMRDYLDRYFYGPNSWTEYLDRLGVAELLDAVGRGKSIYDD